MKLAISAALSAILTVASAQSLGQLPKCAQDCATPAIPKDCGIDVKCICTADSFIEAITCCVANSCSKEDQDKTIEFANGICGTAQVTDLPQSAVCSSSAGPSDSATPTESSASETASASATQTSAEQSGSGTPTDEASQGASPTTSDSAAMPAAQNAQGGAVAALAALAFALA